MQFPVNGPRKPVYSLMRDLGFAMSNWSDKFWQSADKIEVAIFGAGSMAKVSVAGVSRGEVPLDKLAAEISTIRLAENK